MRVSQPWGAEVTAPSPVILTRLRGLYLGPGSSSSVVASIVRPRLVMTRPGVVVVAIVVTSVAVVTSIMASHEAPIAPEVSEARLGHAAIRPNVTELILKVRATVELRINVLGFTLTTWIGDHFAGYGCCEQLFYLTETV